MRIITDQPTIEQVDAFNETVTELTTWPGDKFGIKLKEFIQYAKDGLKIRDDNIAYMEEMERREEEDGILPDPLAEDGSMELIKCCAVDMVLRDGVYVSTERRKVMQPKKQGTEFY